MRFDIQVKFPQDSCFRDSGCYPRGVNGSSTEEVARRYLQKYPTALIQLTPQPVTRTFKWVVPNEGHMEEVTCTES